MHQNHYVEVQGYPPPDLPLRPDAAAFFTDLHSGHWPVVSQSVLVWMPGINHHLVR